MKPKQFTTTSAAMDIDNNTSHVFMSTGLEDLLGNSANAVKKLTTPVAHLHFSDVKIQLPIVSIEIDSGGLWCSICVNVNGWNDRLILALLNNEDHKVEIINQTFISKIFKLELDKAYLGLTR
jgi:hypothetical protein